MSDLRDAARQALEALCLDAGGDAQVQKEAEAITALRAALEQPEQGGKTGWPPGLLQDDCRGLSKWLASQPDARRRVREAVAALAEPEQPEQEEYTLVAWFNGKPVYSAPPRREWRSLSEEEIKNAVGASAEFWATSALWIKSVARAAEAALRSKNHE
jgi:hypothetical protein